MRWFSSASLSMTLYGCSESSRSRVNVWSSARGSAVLMAEVIPKVLPLPELERPEPVSPEPHMVMDVGWDGVEWDDEGFPELLISYVVLQVVVCRCCNDNGREKGDE